MAVKHGGNVREVAEKYGLNPSDITDFSANINPLGIPQTIKEVLIQELNQLVHYPDINYSRLKKAIAKFHQVPVRTIYPGNGASEVIFQLAASLNLKKILLLAPTFMEYAEAFQNYGTVCCYYHLEEKGFRFSAAECIQEAELQWVDGICVCNPNNPTGALIDKGDLLKLLEFCQQKQIHLIVDEAFIDFTPDESSSLIDCVETYQRLYVIRSLTKMFALPGLRLGYLVSSDLENLEKMNRLTPPWHINRLADAAGQMALENPDFITKTQDFIREERNFLVTELKQFADKIQVYPSTVNFLFFRWRGEDCLQELLIQKLILIRNCDSFHGLTHKYYRIAVRNREENTRLIQALEEVLCVK